MERSVTVRTPEAIAFYYELAGLGSRFLALCVDTGIQLGALAVIGILAASSRRGIVAIASLLHWSPKTLESTIIGAVVLMLFVLFYGYFVVFEKLWNGQTPGKRLLGIRVVRDGGYAIELASSIIRNLVRIGEFAFGFYSLSAITMVLSSENKRLGDYAAGTIVVRDRGFEVRDFRAWRRPGTDDDPSSSNPFAGLSAQELALVDRYVARRSGLDPAAARSAAAKIAGALRPKLAPQFAALGDDELLTRIATRTW